MVTQKYCSDAPEPEEGERCSKYTIAQSLDVGDEKKELWVCVWRIEGGGGAGCSSVSLHLLTMWRPKSASFNSLLTPPMDRMERVIAAVGAFVNDILGPRVSVASSTM